MDGLEGSPVDPALPFLTVPPLACLHRHNSQTYDQPFSPSVGHKLLVHTWPTAALADRNAAVTTLQASLTFVGASWSDDATGLTVILLSVDPSGNSANVAVCSPSERGKETSCDNFLDDDCDGLIDAMDPDCAAPSSPVKAKG